MGVAFLKEAFLGVVTIPSNFCSDGILMCAFNDAERDNETLRFACVRKLINGNSRQIY